MPPFRRAFVAALLAVLAVPLLAAPAPAVVNNSALVSYPTFDGTVRTVAHRGRIVYVGGDFSQARGTNGTFTRHGAAAFDAVTGLVLAWNPHVRGHVNDLAVGPEGVYLAGRFTAVKGKVRHNFARVSLGRGALQAFRADVSGPVKSVALSAGQVFLAGRFTHVQRSARARLASVARRTPFALSSWRPRVRGNVLDLARVGSTMYLAGTFTRVNNQTAYQRLAAVSTSTGAVVRAFRPAIPRPVLDIAVTPNRVYAAAGGTSGGAAYGVVRSTGARRFVRVFDGDVQAIQALNGGRDIYVGGHFHHICLSGGQEPGKGDCLGTSVERGRGASLSATGAVTEWHPRLDSDIGIKAFDGYPARERLLVGGGFEHAGGAPRSGLAVYTP